MRQAMASKAIEAGTMSFTVYQSADGQGKRLIESSYSTRKQEAVRMALKEYQMTAYMYGYHLRKVDSTNVSKYK